MVRDDASFVDLYGCALDSAGKVHCPPDWTEVYFLADGTNVSGPCLTRQGGGIECFRPLFAGQVSSHTIRSETGDYVDLRGSIALLQGGTVEVYQQGAVSTRRTLDGQFAAISAICALRVDGTAECPRLPPGSQPQGRFVRIYDVPCGLRADGTYDCWDTNVTLPDERLEEVYFSSTYACGIVEGSGRVVCWGHNEEPGAHPPPELGDYLSSPTYPLCAPLLGDSGGARPLQSSRLTPDKSCKGVAYASLSPIEKSQAAKLAPLLSKLALKALGGPGRAIEIGIQDEQAPDVLRCEGWYELTATAVARRGHAVGAVKARARFGADNMLSKFDAERAGLVEMTPQLLNEWGIYQHGQHRQAIAHGKVEALIERRSPDRYPEIIAWWRDGNQKNDDPNRWAWSGATVPVSPTLLVDLETASSPSPTTAATLSRYIMREFADVGGQQDRP